MRTQIQNNKKIFTPSRRQALLTFALGALMITGLAFGQDTTIGEAAGTITDQMPAIGKLAVWSGYAIGLILVVVSMVQYAGHKKRNEPIGDIAPKFIAGALLLAVLAIVGMVTKSAGTGDATGIQELQLGQ